MCHGLSWAFTARRGKKCDKYQTWEVKSNTVRCIFRICQVSVRLSSCWRASCMPEQKFSLSSRVKWKCSKLLSNGVMLSELGFRNKNELIFYTWNRTKRETQEEWCPVGKLLLWSRKWIIKIQTILTRLQVRFRENWEKRLSKLEDRAWN